MSFLSSSRLSKGHRNSNNFASSPDCTELDPPCTVYLYKRKLEGQNIAEHWALYLKWDHYDLTFEGINEEKILQPSIYQGQPKETEGSKYTKEIIKTDLRISTRDAIGKAENNTFSGRVYKLLTANCQHWVQELGKMLGVKIPMNQADVGDAVLTGATAIGGILGSVSALSSHQS